MLVRSRAWKGGSADWPAGDSRLEGGRDSGWGDVFSERRVIGGGSGPVFRSAALALLCLYGYVRN